MYLSILSLYFLYNLYGMVMENWYVHAVFRFSTQGVKKALFGNLQNRYQCEDYESNPEVQSYID